MRHLKMTMTVVASLVLAVLLGLAGCGEDHEYRHDDDRVRYERHDGDRHDGDRHDGDRHDEHRFDADRDRGEHADR